MLEKIHTGHMGVEKSKQRTRDVLFWPSMNKQIGAIVKLGNKEPASIHSKVMGNGHLPSYHIPWRTDALTSSETPKLRNITGTANT